MDKADRFKQKSFYLDPTIYITGLGKPQKKNPPLMARPLRKGGEGGKGRAIKEKITFFETF